MNIVMIGLGLLFFLGHGLTWLFSRTKIPDLLILILIGYIIGPATGFLNIEDLGKVGGIVSTIALIVILYEGGLNLSASQLAQSALPAIGISLLGFILIVGITFGLTISFQNWEVATLLALGLGSTSSAIVIPMVKFLSIQDKTKTILSLESAFTDVLTIVLFLVMVDSIASGTFSARTIFIGLGPLTLASIVAGIGLGLLWSFLKKKFNDLTSMPFSGEAFALMCYGAMESAGMNGAMVVLALGFTLGNLDLLPDWGKKFISKVPVSYRDLSLLKEISFLLKTFFFLYLGLLISFNEIQPIVYAFAIVILIFITRYVCVRVLFSSKTFNRLDAMAAVAMGPRGLACAVLATIPIERGIEGGEFIQSVLFAVIPLSILFTAVFTFLCENPSIRQSLESTFRSYPEQAPEVATTDGTKSTSLATSTQEETPEDYD